MDGTVTYIDSVDYELDLDYGRIRDVPDTAGGRLQKGIQYQISYTHFDIKDSNILNDEESNPVFDVLKIFVQDEPLEIDDSKTGYGMEDDHIKVLANYITLVEATYNTKKKIKTIVQETAKVLTTNQN